MNGHRSKKYESFKVNLFLTSPGPSPAQVTVKSKGKEEFGLLAVTKMLQATHPTHPQLLSMQDASKIRKLKE